MKNGKLYGTAAAFACAMFAAQVEAAPQPLFDPPASADGRFWRDVDGARWRAVEILAGATSFDLPMGRMHLSEFEEAELLIDVRIGDGISLKKGVLHVVTLPGIIPAYSRGATVLFNVPECGALKPGVATLCIPIDCRALPRDGKPAFPARIDAIRFTCDKSQSVREVMYRDVRIDKKGFFAELSVGNGDFLVGDLDDPARNDPHFTLVNASDAKCDGFFAYTVRHQAEGVVMQRTIRRTFAPNERFRVDLPRPDKCVVYYVDTTIGKVGSLLMNDDKGAFSYARTYSYGAMHPARRTRLAADGEFRFSMCTHFGPYSWEEKIRMADYMQYAGLNCVRGGPTEYWCSKNPKPDVWHENQVCDRLTDELIARGIEPMGELGYPPVWAADPEMKTKGIRDYPSLDEYEKFCERYVREKKGKVRLFECINEPNCKKGWTAELYGAYEAAAHRGLKKGNPDALLKSGEWGANFKMPDQHYARQRDTFDIMAYHYHNCFEEAVSMVNHICLTRDVNGLKQPWFNDECGGGTSDDRRGACNCFQKLIYSWAKGSIGYTWYNLRMKGWGGKSGELTFGLITPDFGPRDGYLTCNMICGTFRYAKFVEEVALEPDVMAFRFERADTDVALVPFWGMSKRLGCQTMFAKTDAKRAELIDIVGNVSSLEIRDGIVTLPAGHDPYTLRLSDSKSKLERVSPLMGCDRKISFVRGGETKARFTVHNPYPSTVRWKTTINVPDFVRPSRKEVELSIPAGGEESFDVAFAGDPAFVSAGDPKTLQLIVEGDGFCGVSEFRSLPAALATPKKPASFTAASRELYVSYIEGLPGCDQMYWTGPSDLSAYFYVFYPGSRELHLRVCVDDDKHVPVMDPNLSWTGDGVQLLLSLPGQMGKWEINLAVSEDLKKSVCNIESAPAGFDGGALSGKVRIRASRNEKVPGKTLWYDIFLPLADFGISREALLGGDVRLNVMVNDRDIDRREGHISLIPSTVDSLPKSPDKFPVVMFGNDE